MIEPDEVKKLAELSRIALSDEDIQRYQDDIGSILGYIEAITHSPADETTMHGRGVLTNMMRADDTPHASGEHTQVLLNAAPDVRNGYIAVTRVLTKDNA